MDFHAASLQRIVYWSLAELLPNFRKSEGNPSSKTLLGIDPPASSWSKLERMLWPTGERSRDPAAVQTDHVRAVRIENTTVVRFGPR